VDELPTIREARDRRDLDACVELQRTVWGIDDLEVTGPIQLIATLQAGALLLVAEDAGERIVGFSYAFPAVEQGRPHLHSDMLAVHPEARGRGLGTRLKWAQREEALRRGLRLVTWTFDPLQAGNARLNLRRLGATATELVRDLYGTTGSPLHHGRPTDRLRVRWELESPSVRQRAGGTSPRPQPALLDAPRVNEVVVEDGRPESLAPRLDLDEPAVLLEIPADWNDLARSAPGAASEWHGHVRTALESYLGRGYRAVDLLTVTEGGRPRPRYVLYRLSPDRSATSSPS
jgi:predicted GNAT superfamily acetyltransferase